MKNEERQEVSATATGGRLYPPGAIIEPEGHPDPRPCMVLSGWVGCTRTLAAGRRQIIRLVLPGEVLLTRVGAGPALTAAVALTGVRIADPEPSQDQPSRLDAALVRMAAQDDELRLYDALERLGPMSAFGRMAHLMLDIATRSAPGRALTDGTAVDWPLTQAMLGELLGLSTVHVNRVLQGFRRDRIVELSGTRLRLLDIAELRRFIGTRRK